MQSTHQSSTPHHPVNRNTSSQTQRNENRRTDNDRPPSWWRGTTMWIAFGVVAVCLIFAYYVYRFAQRLKTFRSHIRLDKDYVFAEAIAQYLSPKTPIHFVNTRIQRYRRDMQWHHQNKIKAIEESIQSIITAATTLDQSSPSITEEDVTTIIRQKQLQIEYAEHLQVLRTKLVELEKAHAETLHLFDTRYSQDENWWRRTYEQREFHWVNPDIPSLRFNLLDLKPGDCIFTYMQHGEQLNHLFPNHSLIHPFHGGFMNATVSWTARLPIPDYGLPNHIGVVLKTGKTLDDIMLYDSGGTNLSFGSFPHLGVPFASHANNLIPLRRYLGYCLFKKPFCRVFFARLNVNMPWPEESNDKEEEMTTAATSTTTTTTTTERLSRQLWREHQRACRAQLHTHIATMLQDGARLMMNAGAVYSSTMSWKTLTRDASTEDWIDGATTRTVGSVSICPKTGVLMSKETREQVVRALSTHHQTTASINNRLNLPPVLSTTVVRRRRPLSVAFTALLNTHEYTFPEFLKRAVIAHLQHGYTIPWSPSPTSGIIHNHDSETRRMLLPVFDLPSLIMRHAQHLHTSIITSKRSRNTYSLMRYKALEAQLNDIIQRPDYWRSRSEWRHFYTTDASVQNVATLLRRIQWQQRQQRKSTTPNASFDKSLIDNDENDAYASLALTASWKGVFNGHFLCSSGVYALLEYAGLVLPMCAHPLITGDVAPLLNGHTSVSTNVVPTFAPAFYQPIVADSTVANSSDVAQNKEKKEGDAQTCLPSPWTTNEIDEVISERRIVPPPLVQPHEFLQTGFQWMPGIGIGQIIPIYDY